MVHPSGRSPPAALLLEVHIFSVVHGDHGIYGVAKSVYFWRRTDTESNKAEGCGTRDVREDEEAAGHTLSVPSTFNQSKPKILPEYILSLRVPAKHIMHYITERQLTIIFYALHSLWKQLCNGDFIRVISDWTSFKIPNRHSVLPSGGGKSFSTVFLGFTVKSYKTQLTVFTLLSLPSPHRCQLSTATKKIDKNTVKI